MTAARALRGPAAPRFPWFLTRGPAGGQHRAVTSRTLGPAASPDASGDSRPPSDVEARQIEPPARYRWSCLVDANGTLEECEDRAGLDFVRAHPAFIAYARGLLRSGRDTITFHVPSDGAEWLAVGIGRDPASGGTATVEVERVAPPFDLTGRELDVLTMVAAGFANETAAARLEISVRTVAKHLENIFHKTRIWSRAGLAGIAAERGLFRLPTPGGSDGYPLATGEIERASEELMRPAPPEAPPETPRPPRPAALRPLLIGLPFAAGGNGLADSVEMLNGAELAVSEINARGGILGRQVDLVTVPFETGNRASILDAYAEIVAREVDAITAGYACYLPEAHDLVGDYGAPYLHAATNRTAVERVRDSRARLGNVFQTCASDVNYGLGLVRFVEQMQREQRWPHANRRLCVLRPAAHGIDIGLDAVDAMLGRDGWTVDVIEVQAGAGQWSPTDWGPTLARIHRLDPAMIVIASFFVDDAIGFQRAFAADPLPALVYAIYSPSVPEFRAALGPLAEGVLWATTTGVYADAIGDGFRRRYHRRFRTLPGDSQAGLAYDRVNLLAGTWLRSGRPRRFRDVATDLRSSISRGVNGAYFLGSDGQVGLAFPDDTADPSISQAHLVFQVQNNANVILAPAPYAHARFAIPPWIGAEW